MPGSSWGERVAGDHGAADADRNPRSHRQATFVYHPVAAAFAARPIAHKCVIVPYRVLKSDYLEATTFVDGIEKSKMRAVIAPPVPPPVRA